MDTLSFIVWTAVGLILLEVAVPKGKDKATVWLTRGVVVLTALLLWLSQM